MDFSPSLHDENDGGLQNATADAKFQCCQWKDIQILIVLSNGLLYGSEELYLDCTIIRDRRVHIKVWKFPNFSIIHISREINFRESGSSQTAIFVIFGALNFVNLVNLSLQKVHGLIKIKIQNL